MQSVLLILTFFIVIITFMFTDLRVGLIAALPNMFPVVILFGVMGYAGDPLNIGTTMAAAIAIGIAVDDTLHFMLRYNQELRTSQSHTRAMQNTIYEEALPVVSTSIALTVGFLVFVLSDFAPVAQFGLLSAVVISTALLADFVITPLAISSLRLVTLWDLLSSRVRQQVIPRSPLFRDMRPWQIRKFVLSSTLLEFSGRRTCVSPGGQQYGAVPGDEGGRRDHGPASGGRRRLPHRRPVRFRADIRRRGPARRRTAQDRCHRAEPTPP